MTPRRTIFAALLFLTGCALPPSPTPPPTPSRAELVIFHAPGRSAGAELFETRDLPEVRRLADEESLNLRVVDIATGAPPEIGIVPTIVFQNHRGRAIYQGRTSTLPRLRNFLRTARAVGQAEATLTREQCYVRRVGRAAVALVVKTTPLNGTVPDNHVEAQFQSEVRQYLQSAFTDFRLTDRVELKRTDRTFYVDFHPYRDETGTLFVSGAVFSQFNCHEAIHSTSEPARSEWSERGRAFEQMARRLEAAVNESMQSGTTGDGFDMIDDRTKTSSWADLGLPLPTKPAGTTQPALDRTLPTAWSLPPARPEDPARLLFQFGAPLDSYTGEALSVESAIDFGKSGEYASLRGSARVRTMSVTMGDPDLNDSLQGIMTLDAKNHPEASFEIASVETDFGAPEFGVSHPMILRGTFSMRGRTAPLEARATLEPIIDERGTPVLLIDGSFRLRLREPFGIDGPDGPAPANDTLLFNFAFRYEPSPPGQTN